MSLRRPAFSAKLRPGVSAQRNTPSPGKPQPFSFYLEQAAKAVGGGNTVPGPPYNVGSRSLLRSTAGHLRNARAWFQRARAAQTATRRLRVMETVSLGEKRSLSIVQVDDKHFLIGTSAAHVQLLTQLGPPSGPQLGPQPDGQVLGSVGETA